MQVMKKVSDPGHKNVVRMLGQVTISDPMLLVMDLCANGDLRNLLISSRATEATPAQFSRERLLQFAIDIAAGMRFLETCHVVHRGEWGSVCVCVCVFVCLCLFVCLLACLLA